MTSLLNSYTKEEFESIIKRSYSYKDCAKLLGYNSFSGTLNSAIKKRIEEENIDISHFKTKQNIKRSVENIFIENSTANQTTLRRWYLKEQFTPYKCTICGQEPFWNGKEMTLILDHINGNNHDNRLENLRWVCGNCNLQLETTNRRKAFPPKKKYYCIDCGKEVSDYRITRCKECEKKNRQQKSVTREELKVLIRTKSFTEIGKQFNVSDNAIRKWCVSFDLPSKKKDINSYSDEEWEKL